MIDLRSEGSERVVCLHQRRDERLPKPLVDADKRRVPILPTEGRSYSRSHCVENMIDLRSEGSERVVCLHQPEVLEDAHRVAVLDDIDGMLSKVSGVWSTSPAVIPKTIEPRGMRRKFSIKRLLPNRRLRRRQRPDSRLLFVSVIFHSVISLFILVILFFHCQHKARLLLGKLLEQSKKRMTRMKREMTEWKMTETKSRKA
jgi:hypothetical protein